MKEKRKKILKFAGIIFLLSIILLVHNNSLIFATAEPTATTTAEPTTTTTAEPTATATPRATGDFGSCAKCGGTYYLQATENATCSYAGRKVYVCGSCGNVIEETISPTGKHNDNNNDGICDTCGIKIDDNTFDPQNCTHERWTAWIVQDEYFHARTCYRCGSTFTQQHSFNSNGVCSTCGYKKNSATPTTKPTVTEGGYYGPGSNNYKRGDANVDGSVTITDLVLIKKHLVSIKLLEDQGLKNADVNEDSSVNATDLLILKQYMVGLPTSYTWE